MAALGKRFDATEHDTTQSDYAELPPGVYKMEIEASDVVPTKAGDGTILKTTNVVVEPEAFKGRKLFNNYNLENKSAIAQEIGQKQFASLCRAIGVPDVEDSEDLHFKAFTVRIGLGKAQNGYPARAEIKRYYFDDEGDVPEPAVDAPAANDNRRPPANDNRAAPVRPAVAAAGGKKPWSK